MSRPRPLPRPMRLRAAAVPLWPARCGANARQDDCGAARVWPSRYGAPALAADCGALAGAAAKAERAEPEPTARCSTPPASQPEATKPAAPQPAAPFAAPGQDRSILPEREHAEKRLAPTICPGRPHPLEYRVPQYRPPRPSLASSQQPARPRQRGALRALRGAGAAGPPSAGRRHQQKGPRRVKAATDTRGRRGGPEQGTARLSKPLAAKRASPDGVEPCVRVSALRVSDDLCGKNATPGTGGRRGRRSPNKPIAPDVHVW